jgi:hypothetical protein
MSKSALKALDTADDIPIGKKLEFEQVILFLKLLLTAPSAALTLGITFYMSYQYITNGTQRYLVLMGFWGGLFLGSLALFTYLTITQFKFLERKKKATDELKLLYDVSMSQEGQRNNMLEGWRKILLSREIRNAVLEDEIIATELIPNEEKIAMIKLIRADQKKVMVEYHELFPHVGSEIKKFIIGVQTPPPEIDKDQIDAIQDMMMALKQIEL